MSILESLADPASWQKYIDYKLDKGNTDSREMAELFKFTENMSYMAAAEQIINGEYSFGIPQKKQISKLGTAKKRTVYSFSPAENFILKHLTFLLYKYDGFLTPNCYSFRKDFGVRRAISRIAGTPGIAEMYRYKVDISNYFNSVDIGLLLPMLEEIFSGDDKLFLLFRDILTSDKAYESGALIEEKRGIMAGTAFAPFLSNIFLTEMDRLFYDKNVVYARYSDDIILYSPTKEELDGHIEYIYDFLSKRKLCVNKDKESVGLPREPWDFLGIMYKEGDIYLSAATKEKIKGKIRRKAHSVYRWKSKNSVPDEKAVSLVIRKFNLKFFDGLGDTELNWSRWFFPLITKTDDLKEIDNYFQQCLRFVVTGKHNKANYKKACYAFLKSCGYRSLVHEYYAYKGKKSVI